MRGHPHIAQHFKIEFFEARFFASAPTPFMPTSKPDSKPEVDGMSHLWLNLPVVCRIWFSARMRQLESWFKSWVSRCSVLVEARVLLRLGALLPSTSMNHCVGLLILHVHLFVADAMKSFDAVDGRILDRVLGCLGLLACYWHTYF